MLRMDQYDLIRTARRVYGKSINEIVRETGHSRNTVKKALRGELCGYTKRRSQPYPVLGPGSVIPLRVTKMAVLKVLWAMLDAMTWFLSRTLSVWGH